MSAKTNPYVLCIAGSDSCGAAGIQADLKTLSALGVHGLSAITAITAQNTHAVTAIRVLPAAAVIEQLDALRADFAIDAVKIGMLGSAANLRAVAAWLARLKPANVVLDPVLISSSGRHLLPRDARRELICSLLPRVDILTPNLPEAAALLDRDIRSTSDMQRAAQDLLNLGPRGVLLKGGHAQHAGDDIVTDFFADASGFIRITHPRLDFDARGTGCTLASAVAAGLAKGLPVRTAIRRAENYLQACLRRAFVAGNANKRLLGHA